ncbi:MAG: carboxynorspermidine decarboxylase [Prevotellaceae bacterium]|nr:carboxynorspermidine decarboxylase [Prevotellaceae bacterium]
MIEAKNIPSPCYVVEERLLRRNLALIKSVAQKANVEIILAFKAFAMWKIFPVMREYIAKSTASSLSEAYLAFEKMSSKAHTCSPVYQENEFDKIAEMSSHITFNSLAQFEKYFPQTQKYGISCGLRINPEISIVKTDLYNPAKMGSRLGIVAENLPETLPEGIEGLHFHVLCENSSYDLEKVLTVVEQKFDSQLRQAKWLNMGGGHLITKADYDTEHLILLLKNFKQRYPNLHIILEPGSAFTWQTGFLLATVEDIVENHRIKTAIVNVSFACHMPDCLEMPYQPEIRGAKIAKEIAGQTRNDKCIYRIGGNSCLSGDYVGDWIFPEPLKAGDKIIFEDMIHYTTVKTTVFNGVSHPSIGIIRVDGGFELLKKFSYQDYKNRMC